MLIGVQAGLNLTTERYNTAIGTGAMLTTTGGESNVAIGYRAARDGDAIYTCTLIGADAGRYIEGFSHVAIGNQALQGTNGMSNSFGNTALGTESLKAINTNGNYNTGVGYKAGVAVTTGDYNICIGYQAGDALTTGGSNILIGKDVAASAVDASTELNIGAVLFGDL